MRLTFWGAAGTVTGSMHQLDAGDRRYLLDCGLYQGRRKEAEGRNRNLPLPARSVDAVILSHAHIDHSGNLPTLVKNGFAGPIYTTPASADLCDAMLRDTAHIQEKDAEFINRRHHLPNGPVEPLYTMAHAEATIPLFQPVPYYTSTEVGPGVRYTAHDAGHMLGSSFLAIEERSNGRPVRLLYSGDLGRPGLPILRDPDPMQPADYIILESTYGGKFHKSAEHVANKLAGVINRTCGRGGRVIVPAFAVGRTQQLVLLLHDLTRAGLIPNIPLFVDSPLAINVTEVFRKHPECFDGETLEWLHNGEDPFGFRRLRYIREASESKKLNDLHGPFLVISASGMCEQGRILHHLRNNIEDPRNTVLITGFQAENTLGRKLVEKAREVRIFGEPMTVRAEVSSLDELSGHADQGEVLAWIRPHAASLRHVFLVHGEPLQSQTLAEKIRAEFRVPVTAPAPGDTFPLA
jgi:metallo-beta-lactamase family protein